MHPSNNKLKQIKKVTTENKQGTKRKNSNICENERSSGNTKAK